MTELPKGWVETTLGCVAEWGSGGTPKSTDRDYYGGGIPWAVIGDLNDATVASTAATVSDAGLTNSSAKLVEPGTVLVAMYGSIGKLGIAGQRMATNQAIAFANGRAGVAGNRFLFWFLRWQRSALATAGKGATQKNISQTVLKAWPIRLPPPAEQDRIVAAIEEQLSRLGAAEANLNACQGRIPGLRRAALQAAFPYHWPAKPLVEVADPDRPICYGILKPRSENGVIPYVEVRSIRDGAIDVNSLHRTTTALHDEFRRSELRTGDVVLAIRGSWDRAAVVPSSLDGANVSRDVARIAPLDSLHPAFLAYFLESPRAHAYYARHARGVGVRGINIGDLRRLDVPIPDLEEQRAAVEALELQLSLISALAVALGNGRLRSDHLRRAILTEAFAGRLVPQDPSDEPASELLARVGAERSAATKSRPRKRA